jgi:hypothetical protein
MVLIMLCVCPIPVIRCLIIVQGMLIVPNLTILRAISVDFNPTNSACALTARYFRSPFA